MRPTFPLFARASRASRALAPLAAALASASALGCGHADDVSTTTAIYVVPASLSQLDQATFFDQPWPSDLRLENGSPRFEGFYNPRGFEIIGIYVNALKGTLDGFSPAAAGYLRFSGPIDETTLPASPKAALDPASSVQLIDIDPASPEHGQRKLVSLQFFPAEGVYIRANTLEWMPTIGYPLRPHTRYALVVTDALQAKRGGAIAQDATLAQIVGTAAIDGQTRSAWATLSPAVSEIQTAGIDPTAIVHLAVLTTADPTKELIQLRDAVSKTVAQPEAEADKWFLWQSTTTFDEYQGRYGPSPNYQQGTVPFTQEGGNFAWQGGMPVVASTFDLRFSLSVPLASRCPMPAGGYPIVLYQHGTGGDFRSYVEDGTAESLASHCLAVMGVDQIFSGTRPGAPSDGSESEEGILFYNFQNPTAARTNGRQSAIDEVQRARLFTESGFNVPASVATTKKKITFDASRLTIFGHSQGGLNGPLFTAIDPAPRGGVFSGSGAEVAIALLEKTEPQPSPSALIRTLLLGLGNDAGNELDIFHPAISMIQSMIDVEDTLHYARLQAAEPRPGFAPRSVYMTEGINPDGTGDSYAPPHGIEAHAVALGLPPQLPMQHPIVELQWGGAQPVTVPPGGLSGDLAHGKASGVLAQWAVPSGDDGHFVVFDVPAAKKQAALFLKNLAASPVGSVPPP